MNQRKLQRHNGNPVSDELQTLIEDHYLSAE
jgi:hypothetical protein